MHERAADRLVAVPSSPRLEAFGRIQPQTLVKHTERNAVAVLSWRQRGLVTGFAIVHSSLAHSKPLGVEIFHINLPISFLPSISILHRANKLLRTFMLLTKPLSHPHLEKEMLLLIGLCGNVTYSITPWSFFRTI